MIVAGKNQGCVFFHPAPGQIPDVPAAITVGVAAASLQAVVPVAHGGERSCCVSWLSRNRVPTNLVMVYEVFTDSAPPEFDRAEAMTVTSGKCSETTEMITTRRRMADLFSIGSLCHVHVKVHSVTFAHKNWQRVAKAHLAHMEWPKAELARPHIWRMPAGHHDGTITTYRAHCAGTVSIYRGGHRVSTFNVLPGDVVPFATPDSHMYSYEVTLDTADADVGATEIRTVAANVIPPVSAYGHTALMMREDVHTTTSHEPNVDMVAYFDLPIVRIDVNREGIESVKLVLNHAVTLAATTDVRDGRCTLRLPCIPWLRRVDTSMLRITGGTGTVTVTATCITTVV